MSQELGCGAFGCLTKTRSDVCNEHAAAEKQHMVDGPRRRETTAAPSAVQPATMMPSVRECAYTSHRRDFSPSGLRTMFKLSSSTDLTAIAHSNTSCES